jgi:hypothetical protein
MNGQEKVTNVAGKPTNERFGSVGIRVDDTLRNSLNFLTSELSLPTDRFVRASKSRWPRLEMGKAVFDGSNRELAVHMEFRLETPGRKEIAVDPPELESQDVDEEARAAVAAENAGISFQKKGRGLTADDAEGVRRIAGFWHVGAAVDDRQSSQWQ